MYQLEQQINLYYRPSKQKVELLTFRSSLLLVVVAVIGLALFQSYFYYRFHQDEISYGKSEAQLTQLKKQLEEINAKAEPSKNKLLQTRVSNLTALINNNRQVFAKLRLIMMEDNVFVAEYLEGLAKTTPDGIWLTNISANASGNIEMQGNALSPPQVPMFIQALAAANAFKGLAFETINVTRNKEKNLISFTISTGGLEEESE